MIDVICANFTVFAATVRGKARANGGAAIGFGSCAAWFVVPQPAATTATISARRLTG